MNFKTDESANSQADMIALRDFKLVGGPVFRIAVGAYRPKTFTQP